MVLRAPARASARDGGCVARRKPPRTRGRRRPAAACEAEGLVRVPSSDEARHFRSLGGGDDGAVELANAPGDFFELLGLEEDCTEDDVKASYRRLQKIVHPDVAGAAASEASALLNAALPLLCDEQFRARYAAARRRLRELGEGGFDGTCVSTWADGEDGNPLAVFVDEGQCIGCTHCSDIAPDTFAMEMTHGRARVTTQWADGAEAISEAIDMCPVDCIYYVRSTSLALLEFVMKGCEREDIAILRRRLSGNLSSSASKESPFTKAEVFLKARSKKADRPRDGPVGFDPRQAAVDDSVDDAELAEHAASIARAFLALPADVREQGWPRG